jgi:hypothetical protein
VHRGSQAEEHGGQHRRAHRECQDRGVDPDAIGTRQPRLEDRWQQIDAPHRHEQAEQATGHGKRRALGHQLPDEPAAAGAERDTDRHLTLADGGPCEHEVRDVRAGDQQQQPDRPKQDRQRRLDLANEPFVKGNEL